MSLNLHPLFTLHTKVQSPAAWFPSNVYHAYDIKNHFLPHTWPRGLEGTLPTTPSLTLAACIIVLLVVTTIQVRYSLRYSDKYSSRKLFVIGSPTNDFTDCWPTSINNLNLHRTIKANQKSPTMSWQMNVLRGQVGVARPRGMCCWQSDDRCGPWRRRAAAKNHLPSNACWRHHRSSPTHEPPQ